MQENATVKRDKQAENTTRMILGHDAGLNHDQQEAQLTQVGKKSVEGKGTQLEHTSKQVMRKTGKQSSEMEEGQIHCPLLGRKL